MVPKLFIHDEYQPQIINNILKRRVNDDDQCKENPTVDPRPSLCLMIVSMTVVGLKTKRSLSLFMNGRHFKILFMTQ